MFDTNGTSGTALSGVPGDEPQLRHVRRHHGGLSSSSRSAPTAASAPCTKRPAAPRSTAGKATSTTTNGFESFSTGSLCGPSSTSSYTNEDPGIEARMGLFDAALAREIDISRCPGRQRRSPSGPTRSPRAYNRRTNNGDDLTLGCATRSCRTRSATGGRLLEETGLTRVGNPQLETPPDPTPEPAECDAGHRPRTRERSSSSEAESDSRRVGRRGSAASSSLGPEEAPAPVSAIGDVEPTAPRSAGSDYDRGVDRPSASKTATRRRGRFTCSIVEDLVAEDDKTVDPDVVGARVHDARRAREQRRDDRRRRPADRRGRRSRSAAPSRASKAAGLELSRASADAATDRRPNGEFTFTRSRSPTASRTTSQVAHRNRRIPTRSAPSATTVKGRSRAPTSPTSPSTASTTAT